MSHRNLWAAVLFTFLCEPADPRCFRTSGTTRQASADLRAATERFVAAHSRHLERGRRAWWAVVIYASRPRVSELVTGNAALAIYGTGSKCPRATRHHVDPHAEGRARCPYLDVERPPGASGAESSPTMASECASRRRASLSHRESLVTLPAA